jgi:hypothetical protein
LKAAEIGGVAALSIVATQITDDRLQMTVFSCPRTATCSTGEFCALAKSAGPYVLKKRENRLLEDCKKSDSPIERENAVLRVCEKTRKAYIQVVQEFEIRPTLGVLRAF